MGRRSPQPPLLGITDKHGKKGPKTSGDSRIKKVGGHCVQRKKWATWMSILHGDFLLFWRLNCYDYPCQNQHRLVNIVKYELALLFTKTPKRQWRMVAIVAECALFVTSHRNIIFTFPIQRFGEVCWHTMHIILHALSLFVVVQLNVIVLILFKLSAFQLTMQEQNTLKVKQWRRALARSTTWKVFKQKVFRLIYLFKVRGAWNKGQLLKGGVVEKRLKITVTDEERSLAKSTRQGPSHAIRKSK